MQPVMTACDGIRVVVVEDSAAVRMVVCAVLNAAPGISVVGEAANGRVGLVEIDRLKPDLVTLDVEMPDMDGLTMLVALRAKHPTLPVVMVSALTGRGAKTTLDALSKGASDYVIKPAGTIAATRGAAEDHFRRELVPRVHALCRYKAGRPSSSKSVASSSPGTSRLRPDGSMPPLSLGQRRAEIGDLRARLAKSTIANGKFQVLAIGSSTGGPAALEQMLSGLTTDFPAPILVAQHMPPMFTGMLAERLDTRTRLRVVEAADGMELQAGWVYVAPGDFHLLVKRTATGVVLVTGKGPLENSCRPAVDVLFRSVAEVYAARALAVVLTGMGYDGCLGAGSIAAQGGQVLAQDKESSVVWGMPGAVVEAGIATEVVALGQMADAVNRRFTPARSPERAATEVVATR